MLTNLRVAFSGQSMSLTVNVVRFGDMDTSAFACIAADLAPISTLGRC